MFANPLKHRLAKGEPVVGHWISLPSPSIMELMASYDPDWLLIDTEHGPADWERVEDLLRAMKGTNVVPLIRVTANDPALIKRALDRGAYGVLVPLVSNAEQARAVVAAAKYPPDGVRGVAGTRVNRFGTDLPDYFAQWNSQVLVMCQVETIEALENIDAIAAVPGVDVLFIGPNDLSASLGHFRKFDHPEYLAAVDRILKATAHHGISAGYMTGSAEETLQRIDQGFRFVAGGSDARLLGGAAASFYSTVKTGLTKRMAATRPRRGD